MNAKELIDRLGLVPHPEGGYYRETYRSAGIIPAGALSPAFGGDRHYSTAIFFPAGIRGHIPPASHPFRRNMAFLRWRAAEAGHDRARWKDR